MCGFPLSAIVLSLIGALVARAVAGALGVPARIVIGLGPRLGAGDREPGAIEVRPIPLWVRTLVRDPRAPVGRSLAVRASAPIAIVLVPFSVLVIAIMARGSGRGPIDAIGIAASAILRLATRVLGLDGAGGSVAPGTGIVATGEAIDGITTVALLAIPGTTIAIVWALVATIVEIVSALRARRAPVTVPVIDDTAAEDGADE